jgi:hypothetical protein
MYDPSMVRLLHPHGDGSHEEMRRSAHDPAASDPEREWLRHGTVYECPCGERVVVAAAPEEPGPGREPRGFVGHEDRSL